MAVPRGKHTKGKRNDVRMHLFIKEPSLISCSKCGVKKKPHVVCPSCGYYKGKEVINIIGRLDKKERKSKEKEIAVKEKQETDSPEKPLSWRRMSKK